MLAEFMQIRKLRNIILSGSITTTCSERESQNLFFVLFQMTFAFFESPAQRYRAASISYKKTSGVFINKNRNLKIDDHILIFFKNKKSNKSSSFVLKKLFVSFEKKILPTSNLGVNLICVVWISSNS